MVMFLVEKVKARSHSWFKANLIKGEWVVNKGLHKFKTNIVCSYVGYFEIGLCIRNIPIRLYVVLKSRVNNRNICKERFVPTFMCHT